MTNHRLDAFGKAVYCQAILCFTVLTAHQLAAAAEPGHIYVIKDGKIVNAQTQQPISTIAGSGASSRATTQAPDINGKIGSHEGLAQLYDELVKTTGYFAQGSRQTAAREDAERVLREHMVKTGDGYGFVRVQSDKAPNLKATPGEDGFLINFKTGTPNSADSPYLAAAKLALTPISERPTMSAGSPDTTSQYPALAYVLSAVQGPDGKIRITYADRDQLLKLSADFMKQQAFKTGREYEEAKRRSNRAESLHTANPTAQTKREAEETKAREETAKVDYQRQVEARAQRQELDAAKQRACSGGSGEGCEKAKDDQLKWYEQAEKTGKTGMVRRDSDGPPINVPSDTPGRPTIEEKNRHEPPMRDCVICEFGKAGDNNLAVQLKVVRQLNTPSSKFAQDYIRQMTKPGALLPRR